MKAFVKSLIIPDGSHMRRLRGGLSRGALMELNLRNQMQRYLGLDERELLPHFRRLIPQCRSLIDVGANDGHYTLAFLRSGVERVIACEPGEGACGRLLRNAAANGFKLGNRFSIERRFVGSEPGMASLAELLAALSRPVLVKLDIEGGEMGALRSGELFRGLSEVFWIVETHSAELECECVDWFSARGFTTKIVGAAWWRVFIPELRDAPQNRWVVACPPTLPPVTQE